MNGRNSWEKRTNFKVGTILLLYHTRQSAACWFKFTDGNNIFIYQFTTLRAPT